MNRVIDKRQAICGVVWTIAIGILLSLWPFRLVNETVVSDTNGQIVAESEAITTDYVVKQMFIAQYDRLKNIDIYFAGGTVGEEFNFVLYDRTMKVIMQQVIDTGDMKEIPGYCTVQVNIDTEVGREYYYLIQGMESPFYVAYENRGDSGNIYNGSLYYGDVEDTEHNILARYDYEVPLRKGRTLLYDVLLLSAAVLVTYFSGKYYRKHPQKNRLLTVERAFRAVMTPVIAVTAAVAFVAVWPCRLFTEDLTSIVFYEFSILLAAALLFYGVNHDRTGYATDKGVLAFLRDRWQNYLQSAMFAGALWACCNYMNGLYEIHHTIAYRQMLIFFALAVIVTYKKKELLNIGNLIYVIVAAFIGRSYYTNTVAALEEPGEQEILVVKLTVWAGVLAGVVIINTVLLFVRRRIGRISVWYGVLVTVFFALIIIYRNTRGWPIYLVCAFTLFYLRMAAWDKKAYLLHNICNGILLHFVAMTVYCFLHRPYMYYQYYRYPFIFHTVTMSAVYLALVVCAAMVKFLDAYKRRPHLAGVYKELVLLGFSSAYLLFTLSRTGFLAIAAMALIVVPVAGVSIHRQHKKLPYAIGMMVLAVLICFPIAFTAQRIFPSVAARPVLHEIEEIPTQIVHGRDMDSGYYITIQRFVQVFQMKVFGIPEEKCVKAESLVRGEEVQEQPLPGALFADVAPILLASTEDIAAQSFEEEEEDSYTNGRLAIFRAYYNNLNKFGHDEMGFAQPNGEYLGHAHNIYLQVAYDHGIYVGIVFILLGAGTFVQACIYYYRRKEDTVCAILPMAVLILFAAAGVTEWIFHPCSPIAYCLLLTLAPLLFDCKRTV